MKINDKAITDELVAIRRAVGAPLEAFNKPWVSFPDKIKTPDGVEVNLGDIVPVGGFLGVSDPRTGEIHHATVNIKNMQSLTEGDVVRNFRSVIAGVSNFFSGRDTPRVIHLSMCQTIIEKQKKGQYDTKYHASQNENHERQVLVKNGEKPLPLRVCKHCLKKLGYDTSRANLTDFGFSDFFKKSAPTFRELPPRSEHDPADNYPSNWSRVSAQYREFKRWRCECCKVNLRSDKDLLHTHHIDGVKAHSSHGNFMALCFLCHSAQPGHDEHMRDPDAKSRVERLREEQELPRVCEKCIKPGSGRGMPRQSQAAFRWP